jgi:hypothetical protein
LVIPFISYLVMFKELSFRIDIDISLSMRKFIRTRYY